MLPQIFSDIHCLPSAIVVENNPKSSKRSTRLQQCQRKYTQELIAHTPKTFQSIHIYFTKTEESSRWICTHLFFVSSIILVFGGLFLHRLSRLLKVYIKWLRVPTTEFVRKNAELVQRIQIQVNPVVRQEISLPKATPKTYPLFSAKFQIIGYDTYSLQEWNPTNNLILTLMGHKSSLINLPILTFDHRKICSFVQ